MFGVDLTVNIQGEGGVAAPGPLGGVALNAQSVLFNADRFTALADSLRCWRPVAQASETTTAAGMPGDAHMLDGFVSWLIDAASAAQTVGPHGKGRSIDGFQFFASS